MRLVMFIFLRFAEIIGATMLCICAAWCCIVAVVFVIAGIAAFFEKRNEQSK